jgi:hypothetical protein
MSDFLHAALVLGEIKAAEGAQHDVGTARRHFIPAYAL